MVLPEKIMQEQHKELQYEGDILLTKTSSKDSDSTWKNVMLYSTILL